MCCAVQTVVQREYSALGMAHVREWMDLWKKECHFDEKGESYMSVREFKKFLREIDQPLGVGEEADELLVLERIQVCCPGKRRRVELKFYFSKAYSHRVEIPMACFNQNRAERALRHVGSP